MSLTLKEARLWKHVRRKVVLPTLLEAKKNDNDDRIEKIFAQEEKICEF